MELVTVWFVVVAFLWTGYLVLEGFDFGVGMLTRVLARGEKERRVLLNTIGPVWDGNEVWVIVAIGAMFAAFPEWYATMLSGFYLPIFCILLGLIVRAVALEYRGKHVDATWRRRADLAIWVGSVVPAFLWGVGLTSLVGGVPVDDEAEFVGSLIDWFRPVALLGGVVFLALFLAHGAFFVALKTVGDIRVRARRLAIRTGALVLLPLAALTLWVASQDDGAASGIAALVSVGGLVTAMLLGLRGREGWAFTGTAISIAAMVAGLFLSLFPAVVVSSLDPALDLTVASAASTPYTLTILSWSALVFTPLVLGYQAWSYWVFRRRIGTHHIADDALSGSEA